MSERRKIRTLPLSDLLRSSPVHFKVLHYIPIVIILNSTLTISSFVFTFACAGFQEDLEKGKVRHLFPAMFAKEQIKRGQLKEEDVPVRARSWWMRRYLSYFALIHLFHSFTT